MCRNSGLTVKHIAFPAQLHIGDLWTATWVQNLTLDKGELMNAEIYSRQGEQHYLTFPIHGTSQHPNAPMPSGFFLYYLVVCSRTH